MKKLYSIALLLPLLFVARRGSAQVAFTYTTDSPSITLVATDTSAGVAASANVFLDDIYSDVINVGFNFNFYGNNYTTCVIGANGNICFNDSLANEYNPWPIDTSLLGNGEILNSICGPFCDMDIVYGGQISYFTYGTAPNRQFVVSYCHDAMYTSTLCPGDYTTTQIILYESTNTIEVHIAHNSACTAWNRGYAIVGVQNAAGTAATAAPGRDYPTLWTTTNEAWRFTPDSSYSTYSVDSITYAPVSYYTIYWRDSTTDSLVGTGDSITLTPTAATEYFAYAMSCNDADSSGLDTAGRGHIILLPGGHVESVTNQVLSPNELSVYPNPAHNELNISADVSITDIIVTDLLGQIVRHIQCNDKAVTVNTADLSPGIYLLKVNGSTLNKFIKQ